MTEPTQKLLFALKVVKSDTKKSPGFSDKNKVQVSETRDISKKELFFVVKKQHFWDLEF